MQPIASPASANSAPQTKPAGTGEVDPDAEKAPWYYEVTRSDFLPIRPPERWDHARDIQEYEDRFGKSDNHLHDIRLQIDQNIAEVHATLASGINYFLRKRGFRHFASVSGLSLREKVGLFADLLPPSDDSDYVLRFTTNLARILWLDCEHGRILKQRHDQQWLYPFYHLADCFGSTAFELNESLRCEHDDFDRSQFCDDEDEGIAEARGQSD